MTDATASADDDTGKKSSKLPLILGAVLALAGGAGGFLAVKAGLIPGLGAGNHAASTAGASAQGGHAEAANHGDAGHDGEDTHSGGPPAVGDVAFVELPPIVVSLGPQSRNGHLRFVAALEVPKAHADEVALLQPRVLDAMNGYLRALDPADLEAADALIVLRAQLTRRVQLVLGRERLRDLLVLEFVLN